MIKEKTKGQLETELAALKRENKAAYRTIDKLIKDARTKEDEIKHLKGLVGSNVPVLIKNKKEQKIVEFIISPEEEIAELQLEQLRIEARKRKLTLEETRQFDLLVKNKRLAREESTINIDNSGYKNLNDSDLIKIAGAVDVSKTKS